MPIFFVSINEWSRAGEYQNPELFGVVASQPTAEAALEWTLRGETIVPRDVEIEELQDCDDCWFAQGPETEQ